MKADELTAIKEEVDTYAEEAAGILSGRRDNYDGADGARNIRDLCRHCTRLIAELSEQSAAKVTPK